METEEANIEDDEQLIRLPEAIVNIVALNMQSLQETEPE
jgi:hypothetical protein